MTCWAASLGQCDGKPSREHLISGGLWRTDTIIVGGFPWCKEPKVIGLASNVAKVLCRKHNSALSPIDTGGIRAFRQIESAFMLSAGRTKVTPREWMQVFYTIDGQLLERWFLKTAINLLIATKTEVQWELTGGGELPDLLVRAAFGLDGLAKPLGLYTCANVGQQVDGAEHVRFAPMYRREQLAAGLFEFRGFHFLLNLTETAAPSVLPDLSGASAHWSRFRVLYHLERVHIDIGDHRSHIVDFKWPGSIRTCFGS